MKKKLKWQVILILMLLFAVMGNSSVKEVYAGEEGSLPRVLILGSYSYGWDSYPPRIETFNERLDGITKLDYIFMDTKQYPYEMVYDEVYQKIERNITTYGQYDLVITMDDSALVFVLDTRDSLFKEVPLVFEGINSLDLAEMARNNDFLTTGIRESFPLRETISLASSIYPEAVRVVGITDDSISGIGSKEQFLKCEKEFPKLIFQTVNTSILTRKQIKEVVGSYREDTILVSLMMTEDLEGYQYAQTESVRFLSQAAQIPIFKADELGIGEGFLGGIVVEYRTMAEDACEMAEQILNGKNPHEIELQDAYVTPMFDRNVMKQFHISMKNLPEGAILLNQPLHFFSRYANIIIPVLFGIIVVILLTLILFFIRILESRKRIITWQNKQNHQLRRVVKERDKAIAMANHASGAKSRFLAQMSHEIRTPMNAILGFSTVAKSEIENPEKMLEYLVKIEDSSRILLGILNDILDMSAIEGDKLKIDKAEFDMKKLIANITEIFYPQAKQKAVSFHVHLKGITRERLIGDELRLNQILINLLSNAIKFTPAHKTIDLLVTQTSASANKVQYRFQISDTGIGMSENMLSRIFNPFEQESAATAKKHGGSGLGLSIARQLTELMGGSIHVESILGEGTAFQVDIGFLLPDREIKYDTASFASLSMLLVGDDSETIEYDSLLLKRLGISYESTLSFDEALEYLGNAEEKKCPVGICLIDCETTSPAEASFIQKVRSVFGSDIYVIVSAYSADELRWENGVEEVDSYISKPLFQSALFDTLMKLSEGQETYVKESDSYGYNFTGKRVLVAEDVVLNMEVAVKILNMVGITAVCAEDGKQAFEIFLDHSPGYFDCILLDINMPVMDGYEAAEKIRNCEREDGKTIPIYAMTANAFMEDVTRAMDAGMDGHIAKPIEIQSLYELFNKIFQGCEKPEE